MPFIDYNTRPEINIVEGIHGPVYHSDQATFGHFTLEEGAVLPTHHHPHEQWTHVISGVLEFTIGDESKIMTAGMTAFIPSNTPHTARVIKKAYVIDCFLPVREDFRQKELSNK